MRVLNFEQPLYIQGREDTGRSRLEKVRILNVGLLHLYQPRGTAHGYPSAPWPTACLLKGGDHVGLLGKNGFQETMGTFRKQWETIRS